MTPGKDPTRRRIHQTTLPYLARRPSNVFAVIAFAVSACSAVFTLITSPNAWAFYAPALLCTIPRARRAQRASGVVRLSFLLDAFVLLAIPVVGINVEVGRFWGAYAFIAAYAALVTIRATHAVSLLRHWGPLPPDTQRLDPKGSARLAVPGSNASRSTS